MLQQIAKNYEGGSSLTGPQTGVVYLPLMAKSDFDILLLGFDVKTDAVITGANALFTVFKNGVEIAAADITILIGEKIGTVELEPSVIEFGDEFVLNLVSGTVSTPVTFNITIDDGTPDGVGDGLIMGKAVETPETFVGKNGFVLKFDEFSDTFKLLPYDYVPSASAAGLPVGLPYWMVWEAFRETGYADGDPVAAATDYSGFNRNGSQSNASNKPLFKNAVGGELNDRPYFDFTNGTTGRWFDFASMAGLTAGHIFFVVKVDSDPNADNQGGLDNIGTADAGNSTVYPFSNGVCYMKTGSSARKDTGNPTANLAAWHLLDISTLPNEWIMSINGTIHYSTASNTVAFNSTPSIGKSAAVNFRGKIAGVYIMSEKLDTEDLAALKVYVEDTYGLTLA